MGCAELPYLLNNTFTGSYEYFYPTTTGSILTTSGNKLNISSSTSGRSSNTDRILDKSHRKESSKARSHERKYDPEGRR
jgi:hypothetical protein